MKELKKVKSRVKFNYEEVEQEQKKGGGEYAVISEDFFDDIPTEITDKMEKHVMKKAQIIAGEIEQQLQDELVEETLQEKMNALDEAINEMVIPETQNVPDDYFQVGDKAIAINEGGLPNIKQFDIVDITNTDGNGNVTDVNDIKKNSPLSWTFVNSWYKKIPKEQLQTPQDAQNDSQSNQKPQGGESCTKAERAFLDSFLELQEAGKLLGMARTGERIQKYPMANMFVIPRVNEIINADKVFLYELTAGDSKEVWNMVKIKAEEMSEKLLEVYKEQDSKNITAKE